MVKNFLMICGVLMSIGCQKDPNDFTNIDAKNIAQSRCENDTDCTTVPTGCCNCRQGGKQRAMATQEAKALADKSLAKCGDIMCIQVVNIDPSCTKSAKCKNGQCLLE